MKKLLLLTLLLLPALCKAQKDEYSPSTFTRFNIMGLADVLDQNLSVGIEHKFRQQWSVGTDVAYIFNSFYFNEAKGTNGIIARPFIRYYFVPNKRPFIEAQLHYKLANYKLEDWVPRNVVNGVPAYEEFTRFTYRKQAAGIHFNFGSNDPLTRNKKLWIEYYGGVGFRYKWNQAVGEEYEMAEGIFARHRTDKTYTGIALPMGVRLMLKL